MIKFWLENFSKRLRNLNQITNNWNMFKIMLFSYDYDVKNNETVLKQYFRHNFKTFWLQIDFFK